MKSLKGLFVLDRNAYNVVYAPRAAYEIGQRVEILDLPLTRHGILDRPDLLEEVELLFSGWGAPKIDAKFLAAAPNLKAIFYAAGAINGWATQSMWKRNIIVTTANHANAIPVAEYTVATLLFSLKHGWRLSADKEAKRGFQVRPEIPGNYEAVVGLVGMGTIARLVVHMLKPFNVSVLTYDPFLSSDEAAMLGVHRAELEELFTESDVVSLHAPNLPTTSGMITARHLQSMKPGSTFINTSRGRVVRESDLIDVLRERPDLQAVLDVTEEEPLPESSPLNTLPNVVLTPHIAGSQGRECRRMGQYMVDELDRYLTGRPLRWQVRPAELANSVNEPIAV
jgi:phosphoglycerate dehydrogenase-like enzyme